VVFQNKNKAEGGKIKIGLTPILHCNGVEMAYCNNIKLLGKEIVGLELGERREAGDTLGNGYPHRNSLQ